MNGALDDLGRVGGLFVWWATIVSSVSRFELAFWGSLIVVTLATVGGSLVCFAMDCSPSLRKYKIQPTRLPTLGHYAKCLKLALLNQFIVHLPVSVAVLHFGGHLPTFSAALPLPSFTTIVVELTIFLVCEDTITYWCHRFWHWKAVYKYIHKVHHEFTAPFGLTAIYTHPIEELTLTLSALSGPVLFGSHILCLWLWLFLRMLDTIEIHSGYEYPLNLKHMVPLLSGASRHDYHHEHFDGNFGSILVVWDWICRTDTHFRTLQQDKANRGEPASLDLFDHLSSVRSSIKRA
ncbi:Aste57867_21555 [Aphanomyces stellatus]|uniref:Aste57867_21555 protein n=1 Tax=Aphanomyces stellatus TaxID=120398 RepID=A0A485LMN4_9STRA|nr:hypothetical protein As57867_021486 [Aphanomyces stellatus]VFT98225.1 Aste57867_21555 [Aphanomyces stellatus]